MNELYSDPSVGSRKLSPCARDILSRLRYFARQNEGPAPTKEQQRLLAILGDQLVGLCYAHASTLAQGPKHDKAAKVYHLRNVQVALADLNALGFIARYASGYARSVGWAVFSEPNLEAAAGLWEEASPEFRRRMQRAGVAQAPGIERYAGGELYELVRAAPSDPPEWQEEDGQAFREQTALRPLTALARSVLAKLRLLCLSSRRVAPPLSVQQAAVLDAEIHGKCWASLRGLAVSVSRQDLEHSERAIQSALRQLEEHGWILPYSVGPLASTAFVVFKGQCSAETQVSFWATATDKFVRRMGRSRYGDRAYPDREIGGFSYREEKEKQQTGDADDSFSVLENPPEPKPATVPATCPTLRPLAIGPERFSPDPAPAIPTTNPEQQQHQTGTALAGKLAQWLGTCSPLMELANEVLSLAALNRVEQLVIERYLDRATDVEKALEACKAQLRAMGSRTTKPRNPSAYLTAALTHNYLVSPVVVPPSVKPAPKACPKPAPIKPDEVPTVISVPVFDKILSEVYGAPENWPYRLQVELEQTDATTVRVHSTLLQDGFMGRMLSENLAELSRAASRVGVSLAYG